MQITFHRLDQKHYRSVLERDDHVRFLLRGAGVNGPLPHDLVHYVVEFELGLEQGFWGSIAGGAVFAEMTWLYGRRRPHATERGNALINANADPLTAAEILAAIFAKALEEGRDGGEIELAGEIHRRHTKRAAGGGTYVNREAARRVCAALRGMARRWDETPVGGTLAVLWNTRREVQPLRRRA